MQLAGFMCPGCSAMYGVEEAPDETAYLELLLRMTRPCPRCKQATLVPTVIGPEGVLEEITLSPRNLWALVNGLGLPEELADWRHVRTLLLENKVVDVEFDLGARISAGRCVIERIHLENGKTLHFAASGAGAMVHMVTEEEDAREGSELRDHPREEGSEEHAAGREAGPAADVADH